VTVTSVTLKRVALFCFPIKHSTHTPGSALMLRLSGPGARGSHNVRGRYLTIKSVSDPCQIYKSETNFRNRFFSNNLVWNWYRVELLAKTNRRL